MSGAEKKAGEIIAENAKKSLASPADQNPAFHMKKPAAKEMNALAT